MIFILPPFMLLNLRALLPGRQIQNQSFHVDGVDVHGGTQKIHYAGAKAELGNADERLDSRLVIIWVRVAEDPEALAGNLKAAEYRDVESVELNLALESGRQSFDDARPQDRFGMKGRDSNHYGEDHG